MPVSILTRPWGRVQRDPSRCSRTLRGFNPHPPVGAGATWVVRAKHHLILVSILTRPWGRVQRAGRWGSRRRASGFNPHPPVGAGAISAAPNAATSLVLFQSSPARGGGCNQRRAECRHLAGVVSILTRPWGRVQRFPSIFAARVVGGFNPHPPVGAGATCEPSRLLAELPRFNPHPPVGAGATIGY